MAHPIRRRQALLTAALLILPLLSCLCQASAKNQSQDHSPQLSFNFDTQSSSDEALIERLVERSVMKRLHRFADEDLRLETSIIFHIQHAFEHSPEPEQNSLELITKTSEPTTISAQANTLTTAPTDQASNKSIQNIYLPFSFLYQLDQGLKNKYPEQPAVQEIIFSAAVEKYLWFELGRSLVDQFDLSISGQEVFALDNFSTLMLINLSQQDSDYILDATEAFLLISQSIPFSGEKDYEAEVSLDEQRYRKAVCLILGKDYVSHLAQNQAPYSELLSELAWDQERIERCQQLYLEKLQAWLLALQPHLKKDNHLKDWIAAN